MSAILNVEEKLITALVNNIMTDAKWLVDYIGKHTLPHLLAKYRDDNIVKDLIIVSEKIKENLRILQNFKYDEDALTLLYENYNYLRGIVKHTLLEPTIICAGCPCDNTEK